MKLLIAELEAATEGSREIDHEIFLATHPEQGTTSEDDEYWYAAHIDEDGGPWVLLPFYSTSVDAALTLVHAGVMWEVGTMEGEAKLCWESAPSYYTEFATAESYAEDGNTFNAALALCIAALRARQATKKPAP